MGTREDKGVDSRARQGLQILCCQGHQLFRRRVATLHEVNEPRAGLGEELDIGIACTHSGLVGAGRNGGMSANEADAPIPRCRDGRFDTGFDDAHNGHGVAIASAGQGCRRGTVASHHQQFDVLFDQAVHYLEGELPDLLEGTRPVREPGRVTEIDEVLSGKEIYDGSGDGEPAHTRVEHPDRAISPIR